MFDDSKLTDHYALIPTGKNDGGKMSIDEKKVYELIVKRFVSAFYPAYKFVSAAIVTTVGSDSFLSRGEMISSLGWRAIYGTGGKGLFLPAMLVGDQAANTSIDAEKTNDASGPVYRR